MQTNKPLQKFNSEIPDTQVYDWYISEQTTSDGEPKYFTTIWLLVECYMYRRVKFAFENTQVSNLIYFQLSLSKIINKKSFMLDLL